MQLAISLQAHYRELTIHLLWNFYSSSRKAKKTAYKDVGIIPDGQVILDVAVQFDSSWQRDGIGHIMEWPQQLSL